MHLGNEVLSPAVAAGFGIASIAVLAVCARRARRALEGRQVPLMGMMGALVFAAQMVNFQILGGSSGHLGGGALLAIALGPESAVFVMAAVLFIQALLFNDGGLLALGANIFNMGILPAFVGFAVFRAIAGANPAQARSAGRVYLGCFLAGMLGVVSGAFMVPMQIGLSGLLRDGVSMSWFFFTMSWVHLIVGAVEGVITFLVIAYVYNARPSMLQGHLRIEGKVGAAPVLASIAVAALLAGVLVSMMASGLPDGLEYVLGVEAAGENGDPQKAAAGEEIVRPPEEGAVMARASAAQEKIALLPDYTARKQDAAGEAGHEEDRGFFKWDSFQAVSAVAGSTLVLLLAFLAGKLLSKRSRGAAGTAESAG